MYRKTNFRQPYLDNFFLPFGGKLRQDNRWVLLAELIPWELAEEFYAVNFSKSGKGAPALTARVALGALIIKEKLKITDEEAVEHIRENPYLQYFLGFERYHDELPFDPSMYVHFRKRFTLEQLAKINEEIVLLQHKTPAKEKDDEPPSDSDNSPKKNKGKLLVDATCTPADIRYPTDVSLLNEAREKSEKIIDILFFPLKGTMVKPRTYRRKARKLFVNFSKQKKLSRRKVRRATGQQLQFLERNLATIGMLSKKVPLQRLTKRDYRNLLVISELCRQQRLMYDQKQHRVDDRIVSISQPHVRPIVRGKTAAPTEFGAKLSASLVDGYIFLDRLSWDAFNENGDLQSQIEAYRRRFGVFPESVHCDKIYRTRENRRFCNRHGIRMSGPPLGRPVAVTPENAKDLLRKKKQQRDDELARIPIEGKFGQGRRRFGMSRIMAKLAETSETVIGLVFMVMNLEKWLKSLAFFFFSLAIGLRQMLLVLPTGILTFPERLVTQKSQERDCRLIVILNGLN